MQHRKLILANFAYAALLAAFWFVVLHFDVDRKVGGHLPSAFASFALVLAPIWLFGFGLAEWLRALVARSRMMAALVPSALGLPYIIFAAPRGLLRADLAIAMFLFPAAISAVLLLFPTGRKLAWQDVLVMCTLAGAHILMIFAPAWPYDGLGALPKIWLTDIALYAYLVARDLEGVGYSFFPDASDVLIGLREWLFFAPLAIAIGTASHFIRFRPHLPSVGEFLAAYCATFFLVAVPEEFFFRGVLQNLLETRLGSRGALALASVLFGLSHFNKGAAFNWRYVLLAAIAGVFYGRAWRAQRRLFASSITHSTVDVVWSLWFRIPHM